MPLPKGYTLDPPQVKLPAGYTLDAPATQTPAPQTVAQTPSTIPAATSAAEPGFLDRLRANLAANTKDLTPNGSFLHDNVVAPLVHVANRAGQNIAGPAIDFAQDVADPSDVVAARRMKQGGAAFTASPLSPTYKGSAASGAAELMGNAIPLAPGAGSQVRGYANSKTPIGDMAGDMLTAGLLYGGAKTMPRVGPIEGVRQKLSASADRPIPGSANLTPRARYNSAQALGVNLDAADATGSPVLGMVKRVNQNSMFGSGLYDTARAANTAALGNATDSFLTSLYDGDRESGGTAIRAALKADMDNLHGSATRGYQQLSDETAGRPMPSFASVAQTAKGVLDRAKSLYGDYPSLAPRESMRVLGDLTGENTKGLNFDQGHQLRSDILEMTRNNPDIVKTSGGAMLQQASGALDNALTDSSGLSASQVAKMRASDAAWKDMKETYDDRSSPFYNAVRTDNPSSLYGGIGNATKTPEMARNLTNRLGDAINPLRRGTIEGALKTNAEAAPNFKTFGTQWNRVPADYRAELFSPDQNATLKDVVNTSNILHRDYNPSGSAKEGQKMGELMAAGGAAMGALVGHPGALAAEGLYHGGQYGAARLMNSPRAVDWLMRPPAGTPINPMVPPAAAAVGLYSGQRKR